MHYKITENKFHMKNSSYFFLLFFSKDSDIKHESNRHCFTSLWKGKKINFLLLVKKEFFKYSLFAFSPLQNQKKDFRQTKSNHNYMECVIDKFQGNTTSQVGTYHQIQLFKILKFQPRLSWNTWPHQPSGLHLTFKRLDPSLGLDFRKVTLSREHFTQQPIFKHVLKSLEVTKERQTENRPKSFIL